MKKYAYQKFLLNCNYENIQLSNFPLFDGNLEEIPDYHHDYCLFDVGMDVIRKVDISDIDEHVDTEDDWESFVSALQGIDILILYNYNTNSKNPIVHSYREATLKAYLYRLQKNFRQIFLA